MASDRKRQKKTNKPSRSRTVAHGARHTFQTEQRLGEVGLLPTGGLAPRDRATLLAGFSRLARERRELEAKRAPLARAAAGHLLAEMVALPEDLDADAFEDTVCALLGARMHELEHAADIEDYLSPEVVLSALIDAVGDTLPDTDPATQHAARRVLFALAGIAPAALQDAARQAVKALPLLPGAADTTRPREPALAEPPMWIRDAYGTRFGVIAPFTATGGTRRWYLWDIDACGVEPVTVFAGYFPDADEALTAWREGVGPAATQGSAPTGVDDPQLLRELLPRVAEFARIGGEDQAQMVEYHRSRRLAELTLAALGPETAAARATHAVRDLGAEALAEQFRTWRAEHRPDTPSGPDADEAISTLAYEWSSHGPQKLMEACSPHRLTLFASLLRDMYEDDFARQTIELLPHWATWLCERSGLTPALADRSRDYARVWTHPAPEPDNRGFNPMARVEE